MSDAIAVSSSAGDAQDLVRAKAVLLQVGEGRRRLSPEALRTALVDLHDFWLSSRAASIGITDRAALVAVGALGRRELAPWSDLDLVLLHDGRRDVDRLADQLWYPLWDAGIGLDHSVRTPGQAVQVAATDLRAAFGLLEIRHIAGDPALTSTVQNAVRQAWRAGIRSRFDEIVEAAQGRWRKIGDVAHRVEPDLKNGHGGLRDIQLVDALAVAQLVDRPGGDVLEAQRLLLDVRTELHRLAGRARDVLRAQDADEVAAVLEIGDRFELARALSGAARAVAFSAETSLRSARAALPRRGLAALGRRGLGRSPVRRPLDSGVVEHAGEVALARDAAAPRDPALVLRVAATAARTGLPVAAGTLHRLADTAPELREPWPRDALGELLSLLGAGRPLVDVVEALDRTGLWGRLFPEWGAVRDLPPRDRAHVWTVDRHLVEATAQVARLTTRVARPDLLLVGTLLHDIGKGRGGDHSVVGESLAVQVGRRLGFSAPDVTVLGAMVRHHLLLPHTATRRDLEDSATVTRVVETLDDAVRDGAPGTGGLLLDLLTALAEADSLATGPGVWSPWKKALIGDLSRRSRALMAGEPLPLPPRAPTTGSPRRCSPTTGRRCGSSTRTPRPRSWSRCPTRAARWPPPRACWRCTRWRCTRRSSRPPARSRCSRSRCRPASAGCPTRRCCARRWAASWTAPSPSPTPWRARSATTPRPHRPSPPPRRGCSGSTTRPPGRSCWSCAAPTGSACCTAWPPRWRAATPRCAGRACPPWARRSSTRSASPGPRATARSGRPTAAASRRPCSPRPDERSAERGRRGGELGRVNSGGNPDDTTRKRRRNRRR